MDNGSFFLNTETPNTVYYKRSDMDPMYIKLALGGLALLACIGLFFGIGLALAAHKFAVRVDPKVEAVKEVLAGAQ
jgi:electron transport complex protein RnfB